MIPAFEVEKLIFMLDEKRIHRNMIAIGDKIQYTAIGGETTGTVKDIMDHVLLVHVAPESWILVHRAHVKAVSPKRK